MNDEQTKPIVSFEEFEKLDIRVAKVLAVHDHPNADKLIILDIDLGDEQRQIVAGLKPYCEPQSLVGKDIVVVTNLQPRKVRGVESNGMLLAASYIQDDQRKIVILTTDEPVKPGAQVC